MKQKKLQPTIGMGATEIWYSDRKAGTIIAVSKNGKRITWQQDKATLKTGYKPEFVPGGFSAICTNNHNLDYDYELDPAGRIEIYSLRKNGYWIKQGDSPSGRRLSIGHRSEYYDYNF